MLKKDSILLGMLAGILMPLALYGIFYGVNYFTHVFGHPPVVLSDQKMMFVSSALNIVPIRYCFKNEGHAKTGQGILVVTVLLVFIIFLGYR
jgi:hypothetical protein